MTISDNELGQLVADYEVTHDRVLRIKSRLSHMAGVWTNFAGILNQNPGAIRVGAADCSADDRQPKPNPLHNSAETGLVHKRLLRIDAQHAVL